MLRDAAFAHPTMIEGLKSLFAGVPRQAEANMERLEAARAGGR